MKKYAALFVFLSVVVFIILAGFEWSIRGQYGEGFYGTIDRKFHHGYKSNSEFDVKWGAYAHKVITDNEGLKTTADRKILLKKSEARSRILVLGDSFTEGVGFNQQDTYVGVFESELKSKGISVEVINGGRSSYSPMLYYSRFKDLIDKGYQFDTVLLIPDYSDFADELEYSEVPHSVDEKGLMTHFNGLKYHKLVQWLFNSFAVTRAGWAFWKSRHTWFAPKDVSSVKSTRELKHLDSKGDKESTRIKYEIIAKTLNDPHTVFDRSFVNGQPDFIRTPLRQFWYLHQGSQEGWVQSARESFFKYISAINELCIQNNIKFIIADYPWPHHLNEYHEKRGNNDAVTFQKNYGEFLAVRSLFQVNPNQINFDIYHDYIKQFVSQNKIQYLNLYDEFKKLSPWYDYYIPADIHFSAKGNEFVGKTLAHQFLEIK